MAFRKLSGQLKWRWFFAASVAFFSVNFMAARFIGSNRVFTTKVDPLSKDWADSVLKEMSGIHGEISGIHTSATALDASLQRIEKSVIGAMPATPSSSATDVKLAEILQSLHEIRDSLQKGSADLDERIVGLRDAVTELRKAEQTPTPQRKHN